MNHMCLCVYVGVHINFSLCMYVLTYLCVSVCVCMCVCVTVLTKCTISRRGLTVSMTRFKHRCHNCRTLGGDPQLNYSQYSSYIFPFGQSCEGFDADIQREILFAFRRLVQSLIVLLR